MCQFDNFDMLCNELNFRYIYLTTTVKLDSLLWYLVIYNWFLMSAQISKCHLSPEVLFTLVFKLQNIIQCQKMTFYAIDVNSW